MSEDKTGETTDGPPEASPRPPASNPEQQATVPGSSQRVPQWVRRLDQWLLWKNLLHVAEHTFEALAAIVSIWLIHDAVDALIGAERKVYGLVPYQWFFDTGHAAVLIKWALNVIRGRKE